MAISTSDCRTFLVEQSRAGNISADWVFDDEDAIADEISNSKPDETDNWSDEDWDREIKLMLPVLHARVNKALTTPSNWKRRAKYNGTDNVKIIREFMCETPDNLFDGQVGYRVLELVNGDLALGDYIGD